jgi:hypothetical protein
LFDYCVGGVSSQLASDDERSQEFASGEGQRKEDCPAKTGTDDQRTYNFCFSPSSLPFFFFGNDIRLFFVTRTIELVIQLNLS